MKAIISLLIIFLLSSCQDTHQIPATYSPSNNKIHDYDSDIVDLSIDEAARAVDPNDLMKEYFLQYGMHYPTTINLFIGENNNEIGFLYEYGIAELENEEFINTSPKDEWGNSYLYYGKLTKLSENVYSTCGDYISLWDSFENFVEENIDFYLVIQDDRYYIVFEKTDINYLESFSSESYAKINKYLE